MNESKCGLLVNKREKANGADSGHALLIVFAPAVKSN